MSGNAVFVGAGAGYIHCSVAVRCLVASLNSPLRERARILEVEQRSVSPIELLERIVSLEPAAVLFSVYIWNRDFIAEVCRLCRRIIPGAGIVLGGPQLADPVSERELCSLADVVVVGEGEDVISEVLDSVLSGYRKPAAGSAKIVFAAPANLNTAGLPYGLYTDRDISTRIVYAESARGCPFRCEYCFSSASGGIRLFPPERILPEYKRLIERGVLHFKFLDRSFNYEGEHALSILDFFLEHFRTGMTLHFEFIPKYPDEEWRKRLLAFPPGALHLELGVQTWNPETAARVKRPFDAVQIERCLRFLINEAGANVHADLIAGLPGESAESFAHGFDRLAAFRPAELQAGILKLLPGTAMYRHIEPFEMKFSPNPPFEVLATKDVSFADMRRLSRFSSFWNTIYNRGKFKNASSALFANGRSVFNQISDAAEYLYGKYGRLHSLSPKAAAEALRSVCRTDAEFSRMNRSLEKDFKERARSVFPTRTKAKTVNEENTNDTAQNPS